MAHLLHDSDCKIRSWFATDVVHCWLQKHVVQVSKASTPFHHPGCCWLSEMLVPPHKALECMTQNHAMEAPEVETAAMCVSRWQVYIHSSPDAEHRNYLCQ